MGKGWLSAWISAGLRAMKENVFPSNSPICSPFAASAAFIYSAIKQKHPLKLFRFQKTLRNARKVSYFGKDETFSKNDIMVKNLI